MNDSQRLAFELEGYMISRDEWDLCGAPEEAVRIAREETAQGIPTAIAKHPSKGWFVIQTAGQGPYVVWDEGMVAEPGDC